MRLSNSTAEKRHKWLIPLLDAYAIIDEGVDVTIREHEIKRGVKLACHMGCSSCCKQSDIPLYPLEINGLLWYVIEELSDEARASIRVRFEEGFRDSCLFLIDHSCAVHAMRPIACRLYNVFNKPCADGEDPFQRRRADVMTPLPDYMERAFFEMLPYYGITDEIERYYAIESGMLHEKAVNLRAYDWARLKALLEE